MHISFQLNSYRAHIAKLSKNQIGYISVTLDSNRAVIFADMLGFESLIESNPIDISMLNARSKPLGMTLDDILAEPKNPLTDAFSGFHDSLKWAIMTAEMRYPLTAITFSDSVFIATNYLFEAATLAVNLAQSMLAQKIPVRMGIAFGSFAALRFRSDVSSNGGDHAAQFLGTAVVRAYKAERCGIKGMRILLHPSVESLLIDDTHQPASSPSPLECSNVERENSVGVRYELNYWDPATTKEAKSWHALQDMWSAAPDCEKEHYQATAEAINRMRIAQGELPIANLRRRVLPRRPRK